MPGVKPGERKRPIIFCEWLVRYTGMKIKTFSPISDIIYTTLNPIAYEVSDAFTDYDAALVRTQDLHNVSFPDNLLAIARTGAGTNNIPTGFCTEKGIVVFNTPGANANTVKEQVLYAMLLSFQNVTDGILGKRLGVIGLDAIGALVANAAALGFDMKVTGYDPYLSAQAALNLNSSIQLTQNIGDLFAYSDLITLHLPLLSSTRGMINAEILAKMKPGAVLINYSRTELVDTYALQCALKDGTLRAYITDDAAEEIEDLPGVIIMPHVEAPTPQSKATCADMAARELDDYLMNGNITHSVNLPDVSLPRTGAQRLCLIHRNITNMVGQITTVLAAEGLNIEQMVNKSRGAYAYTLMDLSDAVPAPALGKLRKINGVIRVRVL